MTITNVKIEHVVNDTLLCVTPRNVYEIWPHIEPFIVAAFASGMGDDNMGTVKADVFAKRALLWVVWDGQRFIAAATTKIMQAPTKKICVLTSCGGKHLNRWIGYLSNIERYAANEGCDAVRIMGRAGWLRLLPDYDQPWVCLEKGLK